MRAVQDCRLLTCESEILRDFLLEKPYYSFVISNIIGKDITHKLYQVQEMLLSHPQYMKVLANRSPTSPSHQSYKAFLQALQEGICVEY
jgi:hypothetical protein